MYINYEKEKIKFDKEGNDYVLDEESNKRPPIYARDSYRKESNGFAYYDRSGYCSLCGLLICRGSCFK